MTDENNTNLNSNKKIQSATSQNVQKSNAYSKQYYVMFFAIMVTCFIFFYWLCNYTKLKEMFQIVVFAALSIVLSEFVTRKYLNL